MDENTLTEVVGIAAGVFTSVSLLPQIIKIIKEKKRRIFPCFIYLYYSVALPYGHSTDFAEKIYRSLQRIFFP